MAEIKKGTVTQVLEDGARAIIRPYGGGAALTPPLPVQRVYVERPDFSAHVNEYNSGEHTMLSWVQLHPLLSVGDSVAFVLFEDGTGKIIDKV